MKKKIRYTEGPIIGELRRIKDFLPPPEELVYAPARVKITMALNLETLNFFKREAKRHHAPYQKMISNLLNAYAANHGAARERLEEVAYNLEALNKRRQDSVVADRKQDVRK